MRSTIRGEACFMSESPVDRCVCFNVTFSEMWLHLAHGPGVSRHAALEALRQRFGCGRGCALCVPYIRAMLDTGRTAFAANDPALRDDAV
jgi:bacterioferritin-associated ferredoxin